LSERFGPSATSTMASRTSVTTMVSIIKVLGEASLRIREHLVLMVLVHLGISGLRFPAVSRR
jgi:hypothetical protein